MRAKVPTLITFTLALLRQLWAEDGQQLRLLGVRAQLDATSTTWLVDQLEKDGFIERRRTDPDRRIVRIWLTDAGRRLRWTLEPEIARWEVAIAETLSEHHTPEEIAIFRAVLWDARLPALKAFVESENPKGARDGDDDTPHRTDDGEGDFHPRHT